MKNIAVLGSGMAGYGAAHKLHTEGLRSIMYERRSYHGGHTASHVFANGFTLDEGPHISFTKSDRLRDLFAQSVNHQYESFPAPRVNNYWKGHWVRHPVQCNLHGLPEDLIISILTDFVEAKNGQNREIRNYADWLVASFGKKFAETFPMEYGLKYHTTAADNMSTDWIGPRLYQVTLQEMLRGALSPNTPDVHYVGDFRYPSHGGFVSFLKLFLSQTDCQLGHELLRLDPKRKELRFRNGVTRSYDGVISSIPLPELIPMIEGVPIDVLEASRRLACSECVLVTVGIDREDVWDSHWTYFYDRDYFFTRLSTPHEQSRNNVPHGCSAIMAECYYSKKYRPLDRKPEECAEPVIRDLKRCGILKEDDSIIFRNVMRLPYANVIFDLERANAVSIVHGFLNDIGVAYCGRYGEWAYIWTDEAFMSGERAAQRVLDSLNNK